MADMLNSELIIIEEYEPGAQDVWVDPFDFIHLQGTLGRLGFGPLPAAMTMPARDVLSNARVWSWDAFTTQYEVLGAPGARINKDAIAPLREAGAQVRMRWLMVDIDTKPHVPWGELEDGEAVYRRQCSALDSLDPDGLLPPPIRWRTQRGMRACWPLATPFEITEQDPGAWRRTYLAACDMLVRLTGGVIQPDRTASDWTRLLRLPGALRMGARAEAPRADGEIHIPENLRPLRLVISPAPAPPPAIPREATESRRRARLVAEQLGHDSPPGDSIHIDPDDGEAIENLERAAAKIANAVEQTRNNTANAVSWYVGRRIASWGIAEGTAWRALYDAALQCGLGTAEAASVVSRGLADGQRRPVEVERGGCPRIPFPSLRRSMGCMGDIRDDDTEEENQEYQEKRAKGDSGTSAAVRASRRRITRADLEAIVARAFPSPDCPQPYRQLLASRRQPSLMVRVCRGCGVWGCPGCSGRIKGLWFVGLRASVVSAKYCYRSEIGGDKKEWGRVRKRLRRAGAAYVAAWTADGVKSLITSAPARVAGETELPVDQRSREEALAEILRWASASYAHGGHPVVAGGGWSCAAVEPSPEWRSVGRTERLMDDREAKEQIELEARARDVAAHIEHEAKALKIILACDLQTQVEILTHAIGLEVSERYVSDMGVARPEARRTGVDGGDGDGDAAWVG